MTITRITRALAGVLVLISLALGVETSPMFQSSQWLWLSAIVGVNLFLSGLANWCPMDKGLEKMGFSDDAKKSVGRPAQRF